MLIYITIIVLLLLLLLYLLTRNEHYENVGPSPYIRLYENFNQKDLVFNFDPLLTDPTALYLKKMVKVNVKSVDLNIPLKNDELDPFRKIEIWNVYNGDNTASSESDFYDSYTEPDFARRANDAKYKLLIDMKAGSRIKLNFREPVKKIFIYARL